jgi:hypothetical protein
MDKSTNGYVMINNVSAKYKGHTKVTHQPTSYVGKAVEEPLSTIYSKQNMRHAIYIEQIYIRK